MARPLTPADHAFIAALSARALPVFHRGDDHQLMIEVAEEAAARVAPGHPQMDAVLSAWRAWQHARGERPAGRISADWDLREALAGFHRWRCGQAVDAMRGAA